MTKKTYPERHSRLDTPKGPARFEAPGENNTFLVYHTMKDFSEKTWLDTFGPKKGKLFFTFYPSDDCIPLSNEARPISQIDPDIDQVSVGEIWVTNRNGDEYEIVEISDSGITLAWLQDRTYRRVKPTVESLQKTYTRKLAG